MLLMNGFSGAPFWPDWNNPVAMPTLPPESVLQPRQNPQLPIAAEKSQQELNAALYRIDRVTLLFGPSILNSGGSKGAPLARAPSYGPTFS